MRNWIRMAVGGGYHGCWIGGFQLLVSPELHF